MSGSHHRMSHGLGSLGDEFGRPEIVPVIHDLQSAVMAAASVITCSALQFWLLQRLAQAFC